MTISNIIIALQFSSYPLILLSSFPHCLLPIGLVTLKYLICRIAKFFSNADRINVMDDIIFGQKHQTFIGRPGRITATIFQKMSQNDPFLIDFECNPSCTPFLPDQMLTAVTILITKTQPDITKMNDM